MRRLLLLVAPLAKSVSGAWRSPLLVVMLMVPLSAQPQTTLTGAIQFSTNSSGTAYGGLLWNTLGGDTYYDLWLAQDPDATLPVNGPADAQAGIAIQMEAGKSYQLYIFGQPGPGLITGFNGLNLFFDGNNSIPGISVFGSTNSPSFLPDRRTTLTLEGTSVAGSGSAAYSSGGVVVVLDGYDWNSPATPPGDVCQAFVFSPGSEPDYYGSFVLQVWPAASLSLSQASGAPGTKVTLTGNGFAAAETVEIYGGHIGAPPVFATTATDASGSFSVVADEPQHPYGPMNVYAVGASSQKLGAAILFVTPALAMNPASGAAGGTTVAYGFGFGAGETVDIYWNNPRQLVGATTAGGQGSSSLAITIPANAPLGINSVLGVGQTTKAVGIGEIRVK